jgi:hypothetical protein
MAAAAAAAASAAAAVVSEVRSQRCITVPYTRP